MKDKIKKLLALSQSSNLHEAEQALKKATQLMEEYQLTHQDLISDPDVTHTDKEELTQQHFIWARTLAYATALLFDCTTINYTASKTFIFVGEKHNIQSAQLMFWHLFKAWKTICNMNYKEDKPADRKLYRRSHGLGFSSAIYKKVTELTEKRHSNILKSTGRDLVVVHDQKVEEYINKKFKLTTSRSRSITISSNATTRGRQAGDKISLSTPITHNRKQLK